MNQKGETMRLPKLTEADVRSLKKIRNWVQLVSTEDRHAGIAGMDAELTPAAATWWFRATSNELDAELKRWRLEYRREKTRAGWRVFRWLKGAKRYCSTPARAGLTIEQVRERFDSLVRV